ncbi:MAG: HAMP domain-containing histidine kinase [Phycisphaerales bacterium]|nr:HAMP domain-containing histidine kinase [Phycisphaerales bacterium]
MQSPRTPRMSLAAKIPILFGVAVLLILAATLYLPWVRMNTLNETADLRLALLVAQVSRVASNVDLTDDLSAARTTLSREWPRLVDRLGESLGLPEDTPEPQFLFPEDEASLGAESPRGFRLESFQLLRRDPTLAYTQKISMGDDPIVRLALAIRTPETHPEPRRFRGLLYVQVPIAADHLNWSLIVIVLSGLSGGFLAVLVFYLVTQHLFLTPVLALTSVTEQVTGGDTKVRADIRTGDEFEQLASAFNDMLLRLNASHEELRTINRSLDVKLEELAQTNVALYESNRLKSEFIANVSHELRTPLGLIINFAELLRDAIEDPPEDKSRMTRYAVNILRNGRALLEIINDLLDLAKIEAGRIELHISEFSVVETCGALIDFVRPLADKKRIELPEPQCGELPPVQSDAGKVKQILYNLLSNAIKFTPEGGRVTLSAEAVGADRVRMIVSDTGPGIDKDKFGLIFEKFRQLDSSLTREHSGTGLGLAITKELTQLLGGSIEVASEVGLGATFTVMLPVEAPARIHQKLVALND